MDLSSSRYYPWVYFFFFLTGLSLLSYGQLSIEGQLWAGLFGLLLPLGLGIADSIRSRQTPIPLNDLSSNDRTLSWGWIFFFSVLFIFIRFYRLNSIPFWPISDESVFSNLAFALKKKWNWTLLSTDGQMEPLLLWLLAFFYKVVDPSILSLRIFTTILSIGSGLAAYLAARIFWDRSSSFIFAALFSFSFWEIGLSRQCTPNDLIPFFEFTAFFLLGLYSKARKDRTQWIALFALAFWCGLGFYTFINWNVVWLLILLGLTLIALKKNGAKLAVFLFITLGMDLPLILARLTPKSLSYLRHCSQNADLGFSTFQYLQGLFWNGQSSYPLGPIWGGYFDAVTGALILVGCLYAFRYLFSKTLWLLAGSIVLCLLPGLLSNSLELQRVTPVLPFFIFLAVLGAKYLLKDRSKLFSTAMVAVLLLGVLSLNIYQLFVPCNDVRLAPPARHWRSVYYSTAYEVLKRLSDQPGPGYVFNEWNGDLFDKTLSLACYPFDASQNPQAARKNPAWVAFLTNKDDEPFLKKRFPHLRSGSIDPSLAANDPNHLLCLFLMPLSDIPAKTLENWSEADQDCREIALSILNKDALMPWGAYEKDYARLAEKYSNDPFLASVLWEKAASFVLIDLDYHSAALDFQKAHSMGYPTPHLEHNLKLAAFLAKRTPLFRPSSSEK